MGIAENVAAAARVAFSQLRGCPSLVQACNPPFSNDKRVFDLVKDFGTSQSTKIDSIFNSLLCPDRPAYVTIPYCTSTASCSCTTPS
ncbi:MAG: hypothetical protein KZQ63_19060 [Candidatus Thiodiazotropha sp. (ex Lucinoma aequizonata)]|nr:hypothetical protein [Candidatus Thiodiazotropha sp. (ex Lucinoma aequizonata)]